MKCVVWGPGKDYNKYIKYVKYEEVIGGGVKVVGVVSDEDCVYAELDGYPLISKRQLLSCEFDLIIVASERYFYEIRQEALSMGIADEAIIKISVFAIMGLDIEEYVQLKRSKMTIFSNCCWGSKIYHYLGLPFLSPLINMYVLDEDYMKLVADPKIILQEDINLLRYENGPKHPFPVFRLGDIKLYFQHYETAEEAYEKWNERKGRINWNNIFFMMYSDNENIVNAFCQLPYSKKVCFTTCNTNDNASFFIDTKKFGERLKSIVLQSGAGRYQLYDVIELLKGNIERSRDVIRQKRELIYIN